MRYHEAARIVVAFSLGVPSFFRWKFSIAFQASLLKLGQCSRFLRVHTRNSVFVIALLQVCHEHSVAPKVENGILPRLLVGAVGESREFE